MVERQRRRESRWRISEVVAGANSKCSAKRNTGRPIKRKDAFSHEKYAFSRVGPAQEPIPDSLKDALLYGVGGVGGVKDGYRKQTVTRRCSLVAFVSRFPRLFAWWWSDRNNIKQTPRANFKVGFLQMWSQE